MHLKRQASSGFKPINANAAGIDIGAQTHWVCIPVERAVENVGSFGCFTAGLYALADWLKECGIQTATMESTGFTELHYFRSLKLVALRSKCVNTHHVKTLPGRQSDVLDCQWSQPLHSYGLCSASFRPMMRFV